MGLRDPRSGLFIVNLFMYVQGKAFIKAFINVTKVPVRLMIPGLFILCVIGSFAVNNTIYDVLIMLVFGALGYILNRLEFPTTPMVIAIILGPMAESNMRRALTISDGSYLTFLTRPISALFLVISVPTFLAPFIKQSPSKEVIRCRYSMSVPGSGR